MTSLESLQQRLGLELPAITPARAGAAAQRRQVAEVPSTQRLVPPDTAVGVFGSLARDEWTSAGDIALKQRTRSGCRTRRSSAGPSSKCCPSERSRALWPSGVL